MSDERMDRNVEEIRKQATKVIRGRIPRDVRNSLLAAVKSGLLGRLPKDGLKPEIFFHPDHLHGARRRQEMEAAWSIGCIATVMAPRDPLAEYREIEEDRARVAAAFPPYPEPTND